MSVSKTAIVNKALTECGAAPVTSIDDNTNNARIASRVYEIALKSILSECKWNFATTRNTLALSADSLAWAKSDENYVYVRPATVLRIFETSDADATWIEEGDYIISDTADLGIKYVYYHDDPTKYPPSFIQAFIDRLCADICYMIVNSPQKAQEFMEKYLKITLPKAMSENAQIGKQQTPKDDAWDRSRYRDSNPDA